MTGPDPSQGWQGQPASQQPAAQQPVQQPTAVQPNWYADPYGRHEYRYFDGAQWTQHVSTGGRAGVDAPAGQGAVPTVNRDPAKVIKDVQRAGAGGVAGFTGGGTLFTEPILVVNQKAKFIELSNEFAIYDQNARQIGAVREVGQTAAKKAARLLTSFDQYLTHRLQIVDPNGNVLMQLTRPAKVVKSRVIVQDPAGNEMGQIVQANVFGKIDFRLESGGYVVGMIEGQNWRAWNWHLLDHTGVEIGRITKAWEGLAKTMFTTADNYVVQIHRPLADPLRHLVIAAALGIDTALKQDDRGFN
jgi:uncharacterized protein YxjI